MKHTEKQRRIYYQDIVYQVCNELDSYFNSSTVCGTVEEPSTHVQTRVALLIERLKARETSEQKPTMCDSNKDHGFRFFKT